MLNHRNFLLRLSHTILDSVDDFSQNLTFKWFPFKVVLQVAYYKHCPGKGCPGKSCPSKSALAKAAPAKAAPAKAALEKAAPAKASPAKATLAKLRQLCFSSKAVSVMLPYKGGPSIDCPSQAAMTSFKCWLYFSKWVAKWTRKGICRGWKLPMSDLKSGQ